VSLWRFEVVVVIASPKGAAISLLIISDVEIASLSLAMTSNCKRDTKSSGFGGCVMERCRKCIMPVTAKGITLNDEGLCQLCHEYREYIPIGEDLLRSDIAPHVQKSKKYNCIVPVSGGRDSTYALYYAVRHLGLKPIAVHNDNDFETEIATRNLDVVTSRLNVPLVRVGTKKQLAKKIVARKFAMNAPFGAQLVVAQTCEACEIGFESAAYKIARKNGITLIIWGDSKDESTDGYHQLVPGRVPTLFERLFFSNIMHLFAYKYYKYCMKSDYGYNSPDGLKEIHLYDYIRWDQNVIVDTIRKHLGWDAPEDSPTTWRIDCSLVPLVNYLTEQAYGVSKIELGFSNMVRNGKMDRDDALQRAERIKKNADVEKLKSSLREIGVAPSAIDMVFCSDDTKKGFSPGFVVGAKSGFKA